MIDTLVGWAAAVPASWVYVVLGLGAAVENLMPAVPADTFVLVGGFLSAVDEDLSAWPVFYATWLANAAAALAMYWVGHRHGRAFFERGWGSRLLTAHQMARLAAFYDRWGVMAVFFTRFLPGLRSVVPVFAGITHQRFLSVALPVLVASGIWYGALVYAGAVAGRNLHLVRDGLRNVNGVLLAVALLIVGAIGIWWWRTRHHEH